MPILIPDRPSGQATPAMARLFRTLKKLPDDYIVWHNCGHGKPHFLVLSPTQNAFLIHVAETSEELAQSAIQLDLLEGAEPLHPDNFAAAEFDLLSQFPLEADTSIRRLLVFPNATQGTLDQVCLQRSQETQVRFLGLQQAKPEQFLTSLEELATAPLPEPALYTLRASFTPESVIPALHRPTLIEREQACDEVPAFLDLDQERLFKQDLLAPPPGDPVAATSRLITGPAGSGKSVVLLHRAILAARLHAGARLLILTHNRPINGQLLERFQQLAPEQSSVECLTFFRWATRHLRPSETILSDHQSRRRVASLQSQSSSLGAFQPDFLADEINYLRDLGIESLTDYLALERSGRLTALQPKARESIWQLLTDYRKELAREKLLDWPEVALRFQALSKEAPQKLASGYDFIFIDEAQFFAKVWFTPVLTALKTKGQLFLSADHTQGFLKRRQSWRDLGIEVVGRSHRLAKVYRSTRQIAEAARTFFLTRQSTHSTEDIKDLPDLLRPEDIAALPNGEKIHLIPAASSYQTNKKAGEIVSRQLATSPHLRGHILIIEADSKKAFSLRSELETHLGLDTVRSLQAKTNEPHPSAPLCLASSLQAATGLEAASVILLGLDSLLENENDPTLTPESATELRAAQTRLIYVALTRAAGRLSIITTQPEHWKKLLGTTAEILSSKRKSVLQ